MANPALIVCDIERLANIAHAHNVPLVIDNTFPTPVLCRPIEFGCDIVVHSTTKYMDGHASVVGGCIVDSGNFDWKGPANTRSLPSRTRVTTASSTQRASAAPLI